MHCVNDFAAFLLFHNVCGHVALRKLAVCRLLTVLRLVWPKSNAWCLCQSAEHSAVKATRRV